MESRLLIVAVSGLLSETNNSIAPELQNAFLQDTLHMARSLPSQSRIDVAVAIDSPPLSDVTFPGTPTFCLTGNSSRKRLTRMFEYGFAQGADQVCIIGPETPHLPTGYVLEAFGRLMQHKESIVIGPAENNGIYLVGASRHLPLLFWEEIAFPATNVLTETLQQTMANELSVSLLPSIRIIDTPENRKLLSRDLRRDVATAPQTQSFLRNTGLE